MANWKMAKALVKAISKKGYKKAGDIGKAADERMTNDLLEGNDRAFAELEGEAEGKALRKNPKLNALNEVNSDKALEDDMEKFIDEASERHGYDRWRDNSGDKPLDDGFGGQMHDMDREDAEQSVREEIIKDLKSGMDISDVFKKWGR